MRIEMKGARSFCLLPILLSVACESPPDWGDIRFDAGATSKGGSAGAEQPTGTAGAGMPGSGAAGDGAGGTSGGGGAASGSAGAGGSSGGSASDASIDSPGVANEGGALLAGLTVKNGLAAWYPMSDVDGNKVPDDTGNGHDMFMVGANVVVDAERGHALVFTGMDYMANTDNITKQDMTMTFWIKAGAAGNGMANGSWYQGSSIWDGEVGGVTMDYGVSLLATHIAFGVGMPDTTWTSTTDVTNNAWHHVALTRNNTSGAIQIFIDATSEVSQTGPTGDRSASVSMNMGQGLVGSLADIRLYTRELTAAEVGQVKLGK